MVKKYAFKKFKRSFKRKFKKQYNKGSHKSVLSRTVSRTLEIAYPVVMWQNGQAHAVNGTLGWYVLRDDVGAVYRTGIDLTGDLTTIGANGYSREFANMTKVYSHCRVKSVSIQYFNSCGNAALNAIWNAGPMSLNITPSMNSATVTGTPLPSQLWSNYSHDGNLFIQPLSSYKSKIKLYRFPLRSISSVTGHGINDWVPCANFTDPTKHSLTLNIGNAPATTGAFNFDSHNVISAFNRLIGSVSVKLHMEFGVPQATE